MATVALSIAGAVIGAQFHNPQLGYSIGATLGAAIDASNMRGPAVSNGRLNDLRVQGASYGSGIPLLYGKARLAGTVLWTTGLREHKHEHNEGGKGGGGQTVTDYSYDVSLAILLCEGPIQGITRIWADAELIHDTRPNTEHFNDSHNLTVYLGNETQNPDPLMQAHIGASDTPAYRGRAYLVYENFQLARWGNRLPNFTFEVIQSVSPTLSSVVLDLLRRVGISSDDVDLTSLAGRTVEGVVVANRSEARATLEMLQTAYQFDLVESQGKIIAMLRDVPVYVDVPEDALGAADYGGDASQSSRMKIVRAQEVELPRQVDVTYYNPDTDYQQGLQTSLRQTTRSVEQQTIGLPIVLSDDAARKIADAEMYAAWVHRTGVVLSLSWRYLHLCPGVILRVPDVGGAVRAVRIVSITAALPGALQIEAVEHDTDVYAQSATGGTARPPVVTSIGVVPTEFVAWSGKELRDEDGVSPGFYVAGTGADGWQGAQIYYSPDGGATYLRGSSVVARSVIGTATTALASGSSPGNGFDTASTVNVTITRGSLESSEQTEVLYGANSALVGNEVVAFADAQLLGTHQYQLGTLRRGLRSTLTTGHNSGERFVKLSSTSLARVSVPATLIGQTVLVKCVSPGQDISDVTAQAVVIAQNKKPYLSAEETQTVVDDAVEEAINGLSFVKSLNGATGDVVLQAGTGISIAPVSGQPGRFAITNTGSGSGGGSGGSGSPGGGATDIQVWGTNTSLYDGYGLGDQLVFLTQPISTYTVHFERGAGVPDYGVIWVVNRTNSSISLVKGEAATQANASGGVLFTLVAYAVCRLVRVPTGGGLFTVFVDTSSVSQTF